MFAHSDSECWCDQDDGTCSRYPSLLTGPSLRAARERAHKRLGDVARYLGLDSSVPPRWEGDKGSTRYKPLPGKYLEPLAEFFGCGVIDIAPALQEMELPSHCHRAGDFNADVSMLATGDSAQAATSLTSASMLYSLTAYTTGELTPSPPPGLPPRDLRQHGSWRRRCAECRRVHIESMSERAPFTCECGAALRARVRVSVAASDDALAIAA